MPLSCPSEDGVGSGAVRSIQRLPFQRTVIRSLGPWKPRPELPTAMHALRAAHDTAWTIVPEPRLGRDRADHLLPSHRSAYGI